ncbi:MAG: non-canonical purine NTP pyrophosphatase, partial [Sphingomonadales bacterium]|nr:non-canonical purine NTP pyrophosphatase [Sphingomonadales bacterium]
LVVPALGGQPGIYSARWGGPDRDFGLAMERVNAELGQGDRKAHFVAVLSLAWPGGHVESFEGKVYGRLVWPPRGDKGFGYDPMFQACGQTITFGEMEPALKHGMSHRAEAFKQLIHACFRRRR